MFIVEIESGVWLAPIFGDPGRTLVKSNAQKFDTSTAAGLALETARKFHPFKHAKITPI